MNLTSLARRMEKALPAMLADIGDLVSCESPSNDLAAVSRSADVVARLGTRLLGVAPERIVRDGRTHLSWRLGSGPPRVLLLGHHDTVWPVGSLASHPFTVSAGRMRGPGCFDMKAGVVMALHAAAALTTTDGLAILITGDEEIGSPTSRELVEAAAQGCAAALVLEAAAEGGALKTERKGVSIYEIRVQGRAAHAGLEPEAGVNASVEMAHQLLAASALGCALSGTTATATVCSAGTAVNTVPGHGVFSLDVRVRTAAEQERVDAAIHALRPVLPGATLQVVGGPNRAPLEAAASKTLFALAAALAAELHLEPLTRAAVGGASDGNFTAGIGTPTLDGLGAVGGGAHADHEHVLVAELPGRTALLAALTADLLAGSARSRTTDPALSVGRPRP